jgi:hypothetical protein
MLALLAVTGREPTHLAEVCTVDAFAQLERLTGDLDVLEDLRTNVSSPGALVVHPFARSGFALDLTAVVTVEGAGAALGAAAEKAHSVATAHIDTRAGQSPTVRATNAAPRAQSETPDQREGLSDDRVNALSPSRSRPDSSVKAAEATKATART